MDERMLEELLRGKHISMEDRLLRKAWPHPALRLSECVRCITDVLKRERWFPCEWRPTVDGEVVREGGVIERAAPGRYVYRSQRHHPIEPMVLADSTEQVFWSGARAARYYLRWDLNLPGKLDGYDVVDE
jgi:hypothetical protein